MPKRKRKCTDSEFDYISKKIRKLERKLKRGRMRLSDSDTSDCENQLPRYPQEHESIMIEDGDDREDMYLPGCSYWSEVPEPSEYGDADAQTSATALPAPPADTAVTTSSPPLAPAPAPLPAAIADVTVAALPPTTVPTAAPPRAGVTAAPAAVSNGDLILQSPAPDLAAAQILPELDPDLLEILGDDPTSIKEYGNDIQKDLAIRLNHIATSGLSKENRKEFKEKYLIPANCKSIKAPTLNPEIRAALIESQAKRDKGIENKQVLTSCALSSLSAAITLMLSSENKNPELLKLLMDTARILGDIQHSDSISRRYFILSTVKKELKDQLEKTKIDEMLFGNNLADTLKSAKTINKSGADLRSSSTFKPTIQKTSNKTPNRPLNYRAPPASRRPPPATGSSRNPRAAYSTPAPRQMTTTSAHHSSSKTSSRPQQTQQRR